MTNASISAMNQHRDSISSELGDGVWTITLKRPEKRNALTMPMFTELARTLNSANENPDVRVIVLRGERANFCAGHDLDAFESWPQREGTPVPMFLHALASISKPLIVGVHGSAAGIGVTLLLHADWVAATPEPF